MSTKIAANRGNLAVLRECDNHPRMWYTGRALLVPHTMIVALICSSKLYKASIDPIFKERSAPTCQR